MNRCALLDGEPDERGFFDWQEPDGVTIEQVFKHSHVDENRRSVIDVSFIAHCRCGISTAAFPHRSDAITTLARHHKEIPAS